MIVFPELNSLSYGKYKRQCDYLRRGWAQNSRIAFLLIAYLRDLGPLEEERLSVPDLLSLLILCPPWMFIPVCIVGR